MKPNKQDDSSYKSTIYLSPDKSSDESESSKVTRIENAPRSAQYSQTDHQEESDQIVQMPIGRYCHMPVIRTPSYQKLPSFIPSSTPYESSFAGTSASEDNFSVVTAGAATAVPSQSCDGAGMEPELFEIDRMHRGARKEISVILTEMADAYSSCQINYSTRLNGEICKTFIEKIPFLKEFSAEDRAKMALNANEVFKNSTLNDTIKRANIHGLNLSRLLTYTKERAVVILMLLIGSGNGWSDEEATKKVLKKLLNYASFFVFTPEQHGKFNTESLEDLCHYCKICENSNEENKWEEENKNEEKNEEKKGRRKRKRE